MSAKTNNLFALSLLFVQPIFMASNLVVARGGIEYVPPISLAFWRWTIVFLILLPFTFVPLKKNFKVSLPVIKKENQMNFYEWSKRDPLKINKFGIPEPVSTKIIYPDILLVPLVAYDGNLNRLGYGSGFYDRYIEKIEKIKKVIKISLAFSFQKNSSIPINQYDKRLDFIVTEKEILR